MQTGYMCAHKINTSVHIPVRMCFPCSNLTVNFMKNSFHVILILKVNNAQRSVTTDMLF